MPRPLLSRGGLGPPLLVPTEGAIFVFPFCWSYLSQIFISETHQAPNPTPARSARALKWPAPRAALVMCDHHVHMH